MQSVDNMKRGKLMQLQFKFANLKRALLEKKGAATRMGSFLLSVCALLAWHRNIQNKVACDIFISLQLYSWDLILVISVAF